MSAGAATGFTARDLRHAMEPLPRDRVLTLRTLLRLTDELRAHVLGGRLQEAATAQARRDALLHSFFEQSVLPSERTAMIEACCAMLDMDQAVLSCLEINRSQTAAELNALGRQKTPHWHVGPTGEGP
ncbi:MAG: hypothetical protein Q7J29_09920 [Stagnimonas sp.]|nr:hypothetical protein [Stagnimonas sp.]